MTAPNLVDSAVVKGFVATPKLSNPHIKVIRNATNSNNVIKINQMSISQETPLTTHATTSLVSVWIVRGGTNYYLFKDVSVDGHPDEDYDFSLLESTIYLEEGDELWACIRNPSLSTQSSFAYKWHQVLTVSYEVITDQSSLVYSEPQTCARARPEWDEHPETIYILRKDEPNTTFDYTLTSPNMSAADFGPNGVQPSSFPYSGQYTTDGTGYATVPFDFVQDVSTGEGDEELSFVSDDIKIPNIIVRDSSTGVVDIFVQGMQSRYGGNIGEIRWYILNANHTINTTLTNFSNGTYNSSSGGYTNSGYRNSWTDTNLNYKSQTVQVNPGNTYYLAIKHRRWSSYNGDYAVDGITINVNPNGPQNYYSLESNNMSGWLISWSPGTTPVQNQGWVSSTTNYQEGWVIRSGNTPSYSTGPSTAGDGSYYVYTETSMNNNQDRVYYLKSPPIYT